AVQLQPLVLVLAGNEGAQGPPRRERRGIQRLTQRAAHLPQGAKALEPGRPGQLGGRGQVAVSPEPQYVPARRDGELTGQGPAETPPPAVRVDNQLAGQLAVGRGLIQVGVTRDLTAREDDEIPAAAGAVVA